jgi:FkbM family methyltransferase
VERLRRNLYLRGRYSRANVWFLSRVLSFVIRTSKNKWFIQSSTGIRAELHERTDFPSLSRTGQVAFSEDVMGVCLKESRQVVVDAGANVGRIAVALSKNFDKVHSFEPDPRCHDRFHSNLDANCARNVNLHNIGLSSKDESLAFNLGAELGHSTLEGAHITRLESSIFIESRTLDSYTKELGISRIDLLKIDVEGHELDVLVGATSLLCNKAIHKIIFEHSAALFESQGRDTHEVFNLLTNLDYLITTLDGIPVSYESLMNIGQIDLVAITSEFKSASHS